MDIVLNESQEKSVELLLGFLLNDSKKYFVLTGGPGYGKSTVVKYIQKHLKKRYEVLCKVMGQQPRWHTYAFTATTNSAADSISTASYPARTIHSALGLVVVDGKLVRRTSSSYANTVVFIDEYTYIDPALYRFLDESTVKVVFIGDRDQLLAVKGMAQRIQNLEIDAQLLEPMRTDSPDILEVTRVLREWVQYNPAEELNIDGMKDVRWMSRQDFIDEINSAQKDFQDTRIISHTNADAIQWSKLIRESLGLPEHWVVGEVVTNNKFTKNRYTIFPTDAEYYIESVHAEDPCDIQYVIVGQDGLNHNVGSKHDGLAHHGLPRVILDLRAQYSSTVYKAQGRSFDHVVIDLDSFTPNTSYSVLTRSLYVGASRARKSITFVGELHPTLLEKF